MQLAKIRKFDNKSSSSLHSKINYLPLNDEVFQKQDNFLYDNSNTEQYNKKW